MNLLHAIAKILSFVARNYAIYSDNTLATDEFSIRTMTHILHLDSSARAGIRGQVAHGSYTRALSAHFVQHWQQHAGASTQITYRDLGANPPHPVTQDWIGAAFTPRQQRSNQQHAALAESDRLIAELRAADVLVIGAPMYNFGAPAPLKAWIDNIVRIRETFDFYPEREDPYEPLLADRPRSAVVLSAHGGSAMNPGERHATLNHLEPQVFVALALLGITDTHAIAIEYEEFGGALLEQSIAQASAAAEALAKKLAKISSKLSANSLR